MTRALDGGADSASTAESAPAIRTQDLAKRYGGNVALAGLTMSVPRGEVFGFLGPNGAGKTTAVKLLLGLTRPSAGSGWVLGAPLADLQTRRRIGYLPELFRYQDWLSAREVLALHCALARVPHGERATEIERTLSLTGLTSRATDRTGAFSKGMQQRLGLAVSLLGNPDLVVLDEPTSALDPVGRHDVREIIRTLKQAGVTVFLNSHLLTEVESVCDRVAIVDRGRVIATGSIPEILGHTASVRMRVDGLSSCALVALSRFGAVEQEGQRVIVQGVSPDMVPALVAETVRLGGQIYAVEPGLQSLEERFLQLLQGDR